MKNASNWKTFNSVTPGIEEIGWRNLLAARSMCKLWLPEGKSEGPPRWRMDCLDGQNPEDDDPRAPRPDKSVWRSSRDTTTPSLRMQYIHEDANATLSAGCKTFMTRLLIHQRTVHSLIHNRFLPRNWQPGVTPLVERSHVTTRIYCILGQKDGLKGLWHSSSLMDSIVSPNVKITEEERIKDSIVSPNVKIMEEERSKGCTP